MHDRWLVYTSGDSCDARNNFWRWFGIIFGQIKNHININILLKKYIVTIQHDFKYVLRKIMNDIGILLKLKNIKL